MLPSQISAVIFDMDGVIIDSEPAWQQAELDILIQLGVPLTHDDTLLTTGLRIDQVVEYWYQRHPWREYNNQKTSIDIVSKVIDYINHDGKPMRGVLEALEYCHANGYQIGLATSSSMNLVDAVLDKLQIRGYFQSIQSAEHLQYGKPHPEVYLNCATALQINPRQCLAIEDSFNGLIAARAANMQTVSIPAQEQQHLSQWQIAHHQMGDLVELLSIL
ncbi:hexitol phosphatase HxpB [Parashewanella spongiae]|uniref:Hexitol phosphatase HxpB n=1 Tax=Parashewanella spongiae TaxID=342950 RepID=A0A3A6UHA1_9GAMM|nr:hexitol phosphatase HxpB [Parashewanella spongiae]MCL1077484.1 hexitol phosphatase HxpB [Parashewanella spongiae]RJY18379.1 hexitol phosphatase HxpB [Parashewanella spongiae]